jgi:hypothetical protein
MRRLKALYLPLATVDPIWQQEVVKAVAPRHDLAVYDASRDLVAQFAGMEAVLDMKPTACLTNVARGRWWMSRRCTRSCSAGESRVPAWTPSARSRRTRSCPCTNCRIWW